MLQKRKWLLLTFYTTAGVMAMERACREADLPGRIVPVPRSITAMDWVGLVLICFVLPAVLSWLIALPLRKWGWIKENDLKLDL